MANQEKKLDKAVEKTFPASDPVTVGQATGTEPAKRPIDRQPPVITKEQVEAAERGEGHAHRDAATPANEDQEAPHLKDGLRGSDYVQRELDDPVKKVVDDKLSDPFIATKKGEKEAEDVLKRGWSARLKNKKRFRPLAREPDSYRRHGIAASHWRCRGGGIDDDSLGRP